MKNSYFQCVKSPISDPENHKKLLYFEKTSYPIKGHMAGTGAVIWRSFGMIVIRDCGFYMWAELTILWRITWILWAIAWVDNTSNSMSWQYNSMGGFAAWVDRRFTDMDWLEWNMIILNYANKI